MKKSFFITFLTLLSFLFSQAQLCNYLAYEYFGGISGIPLEGSYSGQGWGENWDVQNNDTTVPGFQIDNAAPMSYLDLQTNGNYASGGQAYLTAGRILDISTGGPFDAYLRGDGNIGADGTTIFISALLRKDINNPQDAALDLHDNNIAWCRTCGTNRIGFGYYGPDSDVGAQKRWSLRIGNTVYPTADSIVIGATAFIVMQIDFGPTDTVRLFVNPSTIGASTPAATMVRASFQDIRFRSVAFYPGGDPGRGAVDEIRLAESYECAAPDAGTATNAPPLANFIATPSSGTAPLFVTLDGASSSDPDGSIVSYEWDFGDGTPTELGNPVTHSFNAIGMLTVSLTVTDDNGAQNTLSQAITVLDSNGTFSCQTSLTLLRQAECSTGDGRLRLNLTMGSNYDLTDSTGASLPVTTGSEFHNLGTGLYTLTVDDANGCTDTFDVHIPVDSSTCIGWMPDECSMPIGINSASFNDWEHERPMKNLFKHARVGIITYEDGCSCWDSGVESELTLDAQGYPTQLPQTTSAGLSKNRFIFSSDDGNLEPGHTYVFLYDGSGAFTLNGAVTVISDTPGRLEFSVTTGGNIWINVDSSNVGDNLRNFRLLRFEDEFADLNADPYYATYLERIQEFSCIRFMDWGRTNNNPIIIWADRTHTDYRTYATQGGVPYEAMIDLANTANIDVWICVPHLADEDYITQMATLFRDNLDPNLTIYLEYSNEVWNWLFAQAHYNNENRPSNLQYGRAYAEKAKNVFRIWHSVFGADKDRVERVLGLQGGFNYLNEQIMSQLDQSDWDYGSPTWYFGLDHGPSGIPVLDNTSTPVDVVTNARNSWYDFKTSVRQDYMNTKVFGKGIICYEGGQHFTNFSVPSYINAMYAAQYTPEIYDLYDEVLDTIRVWGAELPMAFTLAGVQESIYGSWGHLSNIDMAPPFMGTAPKYQALLDNMPGPSCLITRKESNTSANEMAGVKIFPNPTLDGLLTIELEAGVGEVSIMDLQGRVLKTGNLSTGINHISMGDLPQGIYLVRVSNQDRLEKVEKIVKM